MDSSLSGVPCHKHRLRGFNSPWRFFSPKASYEYVDTAPLTVAVRILLSISHVYVSNRAKPPTIPLPKAWKKQVRSAVLHVLSLAQYAAVYTRGWAADGRNRDARLKAQIDQLAQEVALLREEIRIKDARLKRIDPHRRPHYPATERMAIVELRAARGWSLENTARVFFVTAATVASWIKRIDEEGRDALVQIPEPVNRFPDFTRYAVQRLKVLCPSMGQVKIAQTLARAGQHLGPTTVGRILQEKSKPTPKLPATSSTAAPVVTSKYPNHVWNVDLTTVPVGAGFWCSWIPLALPRRWPFCGWVAVAIDHYSRRAMGTALFKKEPSSIQVRAFLGRTIADGGAKPKHLISDKGPQFWPCHGFKDWCDRRGIKPRFGAVGKHGSIALVHSHLVFHVELPKNRKQR